MSENNNNNQPIEAGRVVDATPVASNNSNDQDSSSKLYTNEEVDKIINKKLARERAKYEALLKADNGTRDQLKELEEREKSITKREISAHVCTRLAADGMPSSFETIFDHCTTVDEANELYDKISTDLSASLKAAVDKAVKERIRGRTPTMGSAQPIGGHTDGLLKSPLRR